MNKTTKYIIIGIGIFVILGFLIAVFDGEYVSKLESIVLAAVTGVTAYSIASDDEYLRMLRQEKEHDKETIYDLQEQNRHLQVQISCLEEEKMQVLRSAICNRILKHIDLFNGYSADELTEIVMRNLSYVKISSLKDITDVAFPEAIKIALCAELGLLELYQNSSGTVCRMSIDGSFVELSDEEYDKLLDKDYGFIVDSIDDFPHVTIDQ